MASRPNYSLRSKTKPRTANTARNRTGSSPSRQRAELDAVPDAIAPELGSKILEFWHFHLALAAVPNAHLDCTRDSEEVDYVDTVIVTRLQSQAYKTAGDEELKWQHLPAEAKLDLQVETEDLELSARSQEIDGALQVFR